MTRDEVEHRVDELGTVRTLEQRARVLGVVGLQAGLPKETEGACKTTPCLSPLSSLLSSVFRLFSSGVGVGLAAGVCAEAVCQQKNKSAKSESTK